MYSYHVLTEFKICKIYIDKVKLGTRIGGIHHATWYKMQLNYKEHKTIDTLK